MMTAEELISEFKRMPVNEQEKVIHFLSQEPESGPTYATNASAHKAVDEIMSEHSALFRKLAQ